MLAEGLREVKIEAEKSMKFATKRNAFGDAIEHGIYATNDKAAAWGYSRKYPMVINGLVYLISVLLTLRCVGTKHDCYITSRFNSGRRKLPDRDDDEPEVNTGAWDESRFSKQYLYKFEGVYVEKVHVLIEPNDLH